MGAQKPCSTCSRHGWRLCSRIWEENLKIITINLHFFQLLCYQFQVSSAGFQCLVTSRLTLPEEEWKLLFLNLNSFCSEMRREFQEGAALHRRLR